MASAAGLGAIALWAFLAVLTRATAEIPPLQLTAMTFTVSGVLGLAALAVTGRLRDLRQPTISWLHGVGGLFVYHALYFIALRSAPAEAANLLNYLWPLLIVLLAGALLGMRLRRRHLLGCGLAACGCLLLLGSGARFSSDYLAGYVCAVGAAVTWAVYSVTAQRLAHVPSGAVAGFCLATALLSLPLHLALETSVMPGWSTLGMIAAIGAGPVGLAFFLWDFGMKRGDPRLLGTLAYATPIASTLLLTWPAPGLDSLAAASLVAIGGLLAARA